MTPDEKILMMERSLRCYVFGCIGLIPWVGLAFAVMSVWLFLKVRMSAAEQWNPAAKFLFLGLAFAVCGSLLSLLLLAAALLALLQ